MSAVIHLLVNLRVRFKPLHTVIFLLALFISLQKADASTAFKVVACPDHTLSEQVSSPSIALAQQIIMESLTDSNEDNGDDETSSKSKHRHHRVTITTPLKFNALCLAVFLLHIHFDFEAGNMAASENTSASPFGKTPITIAIRCLRL